MVMNLFLLSVLRFSCLCCYIFYSCLEKQSSNFIFLIVVSNLYFMAISLVQCKGFGYGHETDHAANADDLLVNAAYLSVVVYAVTIRSRYRDAILFVYSSDIPLSVIHSD